MSYKISNSKFNEILERLSNDYEIYAPVRIKGRGRFSDTDNIRYQKKCQAFLLDTFEKFIKSAFKPLFTFIRRIFHFIFFA